MKRILYFSFFLITIIGIIASGIFMWKIYQLMNSRILIKKETIFTIKLGTSPFFLAQQLYKKKMINQKYIFKWLLILGSKLFHLKAGTYCFKPSMKIYELLKLLENNKEAQFSIRFIEGMRLKDYLRQLQEAPYILHTLKNDSYATVAKALGISYSDPIEGWFWPDTWLYTFGTTDINILKRSYNKMLVIVDKIWKNREKDLPYEDKNQLLTMASIIEKETAVLNERSKVSSVLVNRLRIGMRLQTDSTVIYGMGTKYNGQISKKDLKTPSEYNTYVINGLPPKPIAIPSQSSLEAGAHPSNTPYLYFVANGKGKHTFNTNLTDHNQSVQNYLKKLKKNDQ